MKKTVKILIIPILLVLGYYLYINYPLDIISGFSAKSIASGHFIDHRSVEMIENQDNDVFALFLTENKINENEKMAVASVFGFKEWKAIYRDGLGAILINDNFVVKSHI